MAHIIRLYTQVVLRNMLILVNINKIQSSEYVLFCCKLPLPLLSNNLFDKLSVFWNSIMMTTDSEECFQHFFFLLSLCYFVGVSLEVGSETERAGCRHERLATNKRPSFPLPGKQHFSCTATRSWSALLITIVLLAFTLSNDPNIYIITNCYNLLHPL